MWTRGRALPAVLVGVIRLVRTDQDRRFPVKRPHQAADRARFRGRHRDAGRAAALSRLSSEPFLAAKVVEATGAQPLYERVSDPDAFESFEWVSVEQKFAARAIESERQKGWAFFELDSIDPSKGGAPRAQIDALRLLAVFLAHWDNKSENRRLVCLSRSWLEGTVCREPFLLLQDVGSTFGPRRMDLEGWERATVWEDRAACKVSMTDHPYGGGTFGSTRISERGRRFLARLLGELSDAQLTDLFVAARFDQPRTSFTTTAPASEWVRVFKQRVRAINEGPRCPDA
jgi:hypothetical protein